MRRAIWLNVAAGLLALASGAAHADHDRMRYVAGGAVVGVAVGQVVYTSRRDAGHIRHVPARRTVAYRHVPPPRHSAVVYYSPAPVAVVVAPGHARTTRFVPPGQARAARFVPPGHRKSIRAPRGRAHRGQARVVQVYYP